ncbi:N-acetyl-6-hydroxytryptophan oxidase ivoB [Penicillium argentinense]|uniref:N-acetyl-6-hydroxytryptophan oxidase ivoB n=1 Tax=Penicillium argentinense TaxID=1131581 RepID=A0A9W9FPD6_9EURO|nr:N-acetyl-6-hydroxytryptophan oxidase ivoB [Penicillium argentinense]KAJ5103928.1 N-acetyl-6-hydroxytryptophan oxidase ivoB [Penicillium argentinense]
MLKWEWTLEISRRCMFGLRDFFGIVMIWFKYLLLIAFGEVVVASLRHYGQCRPEETTVRKEWGEMLPAERTSYIKAIKCLTKKPPRLSTAEYPGVRSRFDDFAATHINQTLKVHYSGLFLPWHRRFVWLWEQALRDECGYIGYQPYWNWPLWADDLENSPLFDCSETSLSGNGKFNPDEQPLTAGNITIPRGSGGGCVPQGCGAFGEGDFEVHLGPFSRQITSYTEIPEPRFAYNPRCLIRSLNNVVAEDYTNTTLINALMASKDIVQFQTVMDHWPARPEGVLGPHGGGHFSLGDSMQDLFASPQDPAFMLHHCMIDRLWAKWQDGDERTRRYAINGTSTILNPPWAHNVTLDTLMDFGALDRPRRIGEVMSPTGRGLCYTYT